MKKMIFSITGTTATGTTTLTQILCKKLGGKAAFSEEYFQKSPFFEKFLVEPKKWAFQNQAFFLSEYFEEYTKITKDNNKKIICLDYHPEEIYIYTKAQYLSNYLTEDEFKIIIRIQEQLFKQICYPCLTIYLKCGNETILSRLKNRNRLTEKDIKKEYIELLSSEFEANFSSYNYPIISLSSNDYNFFNQKDIDRIITKIESTCLKNNIKIL